MEKLGKLVAIKKYIEGDFGGFNGRKCESKEMLALTPDDRLELAREAVSLMPDCQLNE